ncbi:MAG: 1-acyl-sn-glycerol-3-phosphate acyltransferase [Candidatus Thiodiazotropha sp. (ex Semelilucina semeliformis)]|nr:1-acyl-sn-glycerol-3-phosphate acyltransferase [Candidatus Thiodiazotropha sp. (ex Semelilucina semeliformis)]MCU7830866.1 1-acyl-sn-glycerol-3-phosphate acyltransferase [Candidatus Thiodiazotropha sp. (ex Myrtea sp. 'scaly one' KF741663)]
MSQILRYLFFFLVVRPLSYVILGLNVRHAERLPKNGPAIIIANHNSHLDTLVLMSLLPLSVLPKLRPAAAGDYFLRNRWLAWFATEIIGIVPVARTQKGGNPLAGCFEALRANDILILFPEGSRGEPERMQRLKQGISVIARKFPNVPITPVFLHGLGKSLPKGEVILIPHFCDVFVGEPIAHTESNQDLIGTINDSLAALEKEGDFPAWE